MINKTSEKAGLPPGTVVLVGARTEPTRITLLDYDEQNVDVRELFKVEEAFPFRQTPTVSWLNLTGLKDVSAIEKIGTEFGLHPLTLEDIVHLNQRPKVEVYDNYVFVVIKMMRVVSGARELDIEQVSIVIGENFVLTFQEREGDVLDPLRVRITKGKGRIRRYGADYLGYAILDAIVDQYFGVIEEFEEMLESLDDLVLGATESRVPAELHSLRSNLLILRKYIPPLREVVSTLIRTADGIIKEATLPYLRDLHDHVFRITESLDFLREGISGLRETYLSDVSNRMNAVMKVLTVIATIFIPLTFIVGVYGMNFEYMPELKFRWGYFVVWIVMLVIAGAMVGYFRKKNWF
ncbi:MAG: magnesium and cobalt transport protein CorA [Candidatus Zixiibacteriota bacterium]|nr:MAG: magnesium and cobalt transport protein CorA [candidate division Zixibacteria bacterium]